MSNTDKVRNEIAKILYNQGTYSEFDYDTESPNNKEYWKKQADQILSIKEIRIEAGNQEPPEYKACNGLIFTSGSRISQDGYNKAIATIQINNFIKCEPKGGSNAKS